MAGDINRVTIIGRLTRDPELKYTQGGAAIGNFSIANNRTYTTGSGEKKEEVNYFDCIAWGKLGEIITEHCRKGRRIAVEGRLQQRRWEDQNGNKRSKIEIVVDNFQFLDAKEAQENAPGPAVVSPPVSSPPVTAENNPFADNDIPF